MAYCIGMQMIMKFVLDYENPAWFMYTIFQAVKK